MLLKPVWSRSWVDDQCW